MSIQNKLSFSTDRAEVLELLRSAAKKKKKNGFGQILAIYQDEIARLYGYQNWSVLHSNVSKMTEFEFVRFAALVMQKHGAQRTLSAKSEPCESTLIKCRLFSSNIGYLAREFNDGETQAIILADSNKIRAMMKLSRAHYNAAKVEMHKERLRKGFFEIPLITPRGDNLHWIEGVHQVNAAVEDGLTSLPLGTSLALASRVKELVGASSDVVTRYDFSACEAVIM